MTRTLLAFTVSLGLIFPGAAATLPRPSPEFAIQMTPSGQTLLTQYKGKVVVLMLISTTCPHCQQTTKMMSEIQKEYKDRGVQVLAAAFNEMANMLVPDFIKQFEPAFPLGYANRDAVLTYLQHPVMMQLYVPSLVFIDRKGMIRYQHTGEDPFIAQNQEKNVRETIETLLKDPVATKKTLGATSQKKKAS